MITMNSINHDTRLVYYGMSYTDHVVYRYNVVDPRP